jgi:hypothetical protein
VLVGRLLKLEYVYKNKPQIWHRPFYNGLLDGLKRVVSEEGAGALWRHGFVSDVLSRISFTEGNALSSAHQHCHWMPLHDTCPNMMINCTHTPIAIAGLY